MKIFISIILIITITGCCCPDNTKSAEPSIVIDKKYFKETDVWVFIYIKNGHKHTYASEFDKYSIGDVIK